MAHLIKLAVGARTIEDIEAWQASRAQGSPTHVAAGGATHLAAGRATHVVPTRQFPKRAPEIVAGGSLFWVVAGLVSVRQEIADIHEIRGEDGTRGTAIHVRRTLIPVALRPMRAFQGWRYLERDAAPLDLAAGTHAADNTLPPALLRELAALCLI